MTIKRKSGFNIITELICVLIIVVFYIKNINRLLMPSIIYDEIGYWASAAWWNGWDWSDIMSNFSSYYSYGYSTILFVLMQLFHNPEILHQSAIVFNIFMVVIGYIVILNFINWLFPNINTITKNILCMLPLFSPSVQYHTQVAWSETLLFFLFLISIISIKKMIQNKSIISFVIYAFLLIYMYITHQRTVGILISGILLSLIISFISKSWKQFIALMCTVSILLVCISIIKQQILINVYSNANGDISLYVNGNDYIGQITKIKHLFSLEGFYDFLISLFGIVYYFFLSSFFIGG